MRVERNKQSRREMQTKINKALSAKPTAAYINSRGLTPEQIEKAYGVPKMPRTRANIAGEDVRRGVHKGRGKTNTHARPVVSGTFVAPNHSNFAVPRWFESFGNVDVSIIVPMYNSKDVIREQIEQWDVTNDGLTKEIIYVNDACPQESYQQVIASWNIKKELWDRPIGRIILNHENAGFAFSCNIGAKYATGKYLVFLNADAVVTPNWLRPMIDLIQSDEHIGIVGNLQLRKHSEIVESAGSEWDGKMFSHVGRNIYKGAALTTPFTRQNLPEALNQPDERQMVTGSCLLISKKLFQTVGGFDTEYRIGYWEDSDLNMKVRTLGYKVYYTPKSLIYHTPGHAQSGHNYNVEQNRQKFFRDWVDTNVIHRLNRPSGALIKNVNAVVYTAVTAGYDDLIPAQNTQGAAKFVAFMEETAQSPVWEVQRLQKQHADPNRNAKIYKILSHQFFPDYEYSLWMDGNVRLLVPVDHLIRTLMRDVDLVVFKHPERDCLYQEADTCSSRLLDDRGTIAAQVNRYKAEGFPAHAGLAECTILLRRHCPAVERFNQAWWDEICKGSKRDQISFPYVARKQGLRFAYFPGNLRTNNFIFNKTTTHRRK